MGILDKILRRNKRDVEGELTKAREKAYQVEDIARKIGEARTQKAIYKRYKEDILNKEKPQIERVSKQEQAEIEKRAFLKKRILELVEEKEKQSEVELAEKGMSVVKEIEKQPTETPNESIVAKVRKTLIEIGDHKNWSDRLVDEGVFKTRKEAKAYASFMRAKGYYVKMVKVQGGYKVYVYSRKGKASFILEGNWKALKSLEKVNTKPLKAKTPKVNQFSLQTFDVNMSVPSMPRYDINLDFNALNSFDMNLDLGELNFDFGFDLLRGSGGGKRGKKKV